MTWLISYKQAPPPRVNNSLTDGRTLAESKDSAYVSIASRGKINKKKIGNV